MSFDKIPAWAKDALEKPSAFDMAEYQVLKAFYLAWEELHAVPNEKINRKQKEAAAQALVDQALILRRMLNEKPAILVPRFTQ